MRWATLLLVTVLFSGCVANEPAPAPVAEQSDTPQSPAPTTAAAPEPEPSSDPEPQPGPGQNNTEPEQNSTTSPEENNTSEPSNEPKPFEPQGTNKACNSLEVVTPLAADASGLVLGWELQILDVAVIADPYFVEAHPDDWGSLLEALVLDANPHYEAQMGLRLNPIIIDALPPGTLDKSASPDLIWDTARGFMAVNYPDSAHDYVAVILGEDYNGSTAGQVNCVHGAYDPETAYLWSEYDGPRGAGYENYLGAPVDLFYDQPLKVFMHETAHLLAAHHHYTNCGEAMAGYGTDDSLAVCGVMINDIGLASFTFSPTNRLIMRSFVEETGIGTPA